MIKIGKLINEQQFIVAPDAILDPTYVFGETINEELYTDITSNESWLSIGLYNYDYLFCREQVKSRGLSLDYNDPKMIYELKSASEHFCTTKAFRDTVFSEAEQEKFWESFVSKAYQTRLDRWVKAKGYISYILAPSDSTDLALETELLSKNFVEYGIISVAVSGVNGLIDWLESTYLSKTYYNVTHKNNILLILTTGSY
jgi:hypothetical protein